MLSVTNEDTPCVSLFDALLRPFNRDVPSHLDWMARPRRPQIDSDLDPRDPRDINAIMAQLLVRDIEDEVVRELKMRAASKGISAEAEHREILRQALLSGRARDTLKDRLAAMPAVGKDADFDFVRDLDRGE